MVHLKTVYIIVLTTTSLAQAWMINRPSKEKIDVSETTEYVCFPWIFNPGCPLSKWIGWDVVCRTNTLGWEMCEFIKNSDKKKIEANTSTSSTKGEEKNDADNPHFKAEDIIIINNVHVNNHSIVVTSTSSSEGVLHELAQIESGQDENTIIDHIVGNLAAVHGDKQESSNEQQPQVIRLEDVVLLNPASSSYNSPSSIVDEISGIVNASIQGFQDKLSQTSEVEFDFPSIFLESVPRDSSSEAHAIEETSTLKTAEELSYPNSDKISEEALDILVTEVFSDDHEVEEELVNQFSDEDPFVKESTAPEVFVIENLKPFTYKVNQQPADLPEFNLINQGTDNEIPEIISLKPFRFVPIVKVIKHKDSGDSLLNTVQENLNAEIKEFDIIKPRVSPNIS